MDEFLKLAKILKDIKGFLTYLVICGYIALGDDGEYKPKYIRFAGNLKFYISDETYDFLLGLGK